MTTDQTPEPLDNVQADLGEASTTPAPALDRGHSMRITLNGGSSPTYRLICHEPDSAVCHAKWDCGCESWGEDGVTDGRAWHSAYNDEDDDVTHWGTPSGDCDRVNEYDASDVDELGPQFEHVIDLPVALSWEGEYHLWYVRPSELPANSQSVQDLTLDVERLTRERETWKALAEAPPLYSTRTALARAEKAEAELARLHSWDGLMELLDEHYPEDLIPTTPDDDLRDRGPRIVSLIRWLDRERAKVRAVEAALAPYPGVCDVHDDDDPVSCGWKRAVMDVTAALAAEAPQQVEGDEVDGKPGVLVSFPDQYLGVRLDGDKHTTRCHPTWRVEPEGDGSDGE